MRSLNQIEVNFSETVTGVDAADLLINGVPATSVTPLAPGQFVFGFAQPGVGTVQVGFAAGHNIRDLAAVPNNFTGASWSYVLDPNAVVTSVRLNELAATYPDPDAILSAYRQNPDAMRQVESMVLEDQVVDYLLERAKVTDQPSTFKELMNFGA